jgi:hypothetical protein
VVPVAQRTEGAVHADLHGADGGVEEAGDLLVRQSLEAGEHEDFALFVGKGGEGAAYYVINKFSGKLEL